MIKLINQACLQMAEQVSKVDFAVSNTTLLQVYLSVH